MGAFFGAQTYLLLDYALEAAGWLAARAGMAPWLAGAAVTLLLLRLAWRLRAARLEARLAEAELEALRARLHPHFLFNTLHAISTLMHRDVEAADRMLADLSDLLRLSLGTHTGQAVPLQQELDVLEHYLKIEQTRFQDRLTVQMTIDPATLDAQVPSLILQPLVENAIRHGIAPRAGAGRVEILARCDHRRLHLEVRDDGCGLPPAEHGRPQEGPGLANTRARLRQLYGAAQRFELAPAPGGGAVASLEIPFLPCPPEDQEVIYEKSGAPAALAH